MRTFIGLAWSIILITLTGVLGGCSNETGALGDPVEAPEARSTQDRLEAATVSLPAVPVETVVEVGVRLPQEETTSSRTALEARTGEVRLSATPQGLILEHLTLSLEDGVVSPERLAPNGLTLTGVHLSTVEPAAAPVRWFGRGNEGYAEIEADLWLDWKLVPPGRPDAEPWPLEGQRLEDVTFDVHVTTDRHGNLLAEITGSAPGTFWSWGELAEMSDAEIRVLAIETEEVQR